VKNLVKAVLRNFGYELRRITGLASLEGQLITLLKSHEIGLVFDIGANAGQFGNTLRHFGYKGKIVSFEPQSDAWETLNNVSSIDPNWFCAPRTAIGSTTGQVKLNVSENSVSSSFLSIGLDHLLAAPTSRYVRSEEVQMFRLDDLAPQYVQQGVPYAIKIDVQGYEREVIIGALDSLFGAKFVVIEMSLTELYEGQRLIDETISYLRSLNFNLWGLFPAFLSVKTGRLLQVDGVFVQERKYLG